MKRYLPAISCAVIIGGCFLIAGFIWLKSKVCRFDPEPGVEDYHACEDFERAAHAENEEWRDEE